MNRIILLLLSLSILISCGEALKVTNESDDNPIAPSQIIVIANDKKNVISWANDIAYTYNIYWTINASEDPIDSTNIIEGVSSPYTHQRLTNAQTYYYVVTAKLGDNESIPTAKQSATPKAGTTTLPSPDNFIVDVVSDSSLQLGWNSVAGAVSYKIYWSDNIAVDPVASGNTPITLNKTEYLHTGLEANKTYFYALSAQALGVESIPTEKIWKTVAGTLPDRPTNLRVRNFGNKLLTLEWDGTQADARYIIYWSTTGPLNDLTTAKRKELSIGEQEFILTGLTPGNTVYFQIVSVVGDVEGTPSDLFMTVYPQLPDISDPLILPPNNILTSIDRTDPTNFKATISWTAPDPAYRYRVLYANAPGITYSNYLMLRNGGSSPEISGTSFTIDRLSLGFQYYFVLVSVTDTGRSQETVEKSVIISITDQDFNNADMENGAQLYDKWWANIAAAPSNTNPVWTDVAVDRENKPFNKANILDRWRCSECHGWDYRGKDGNYGAGSVHYTGFPGLHETAINKSKEQIFAFIKSGRTDTGRSHSFGNLDSQSILDLTRFIIDGITDVDNIWQGDPIKGESIFTLTNASGQSCNEAGCHASGQSTQLDITRLLTSAENWPARFVHYARFGTNGMPGGISVQDAKDVLAYIWQENNPVGVSNFDTALYEKAGAELNTQWALGGVLYDRWWKVEKDNAKKTVPESNHPLWTPTGSKINGAGTWRCKECHGWDYAGKAGAYGRGQHFSGVKGLNDDIVRITAKQLYDYLKNGKLHGFSEYLSDESIYALTRFITITREEINSANAPDDFIDRVKEEPLIHDITQGESSYKQPTSGGGCITCHINPGTNWLFFDSDPDRGILQTVATIGKDNPWEFLHKIRFGQPGSNMQGLIELDSTLKVDSMDYAMNLLAYAQTNLDRDIKRGGRLYDTWWLENTLEEPIAAHGLWPSGDASVSPIDTWRCSSCHGWDYLGNLGISGVISPANDVVEFISNGMVNVPGDHNFSEQLKNQDIADLSFFITDTEQRGVRDDVTLALGMASQIQGEIVYKTDTPGNCINCHGENGTSIPTVDLKSVAINESKRFIHKVRFGSPGSIMKPIPGGFSGLDLENAANVHAYSETITGGAPDPGNGGFDASVDRGGRLFDNWFVEMRASDPTVENPVVENPLWTSRNPVIPDVQSLSDSWRCVSCHNWNYKGKDLLSFAPEADNLLTKLATRREAFPGDEALQTYLVNWIKNGTSTRHNYGSIDSALPTVLGDRELQDLALFLMQGILDTNEYIYNIGGKVVTPDIVKGKALYEGVTIPAVKCIDCHGVTGEAIPPGGSQSVDIFALAITNSWQFFHKVRFSSPGTDMPSLSGLPGATLQQAADVLSYAQSEFELRK